MYFPYRRWRSDLVNTGKPFDESVFSGREELHGKRLERRIGRQAKSLGLIDHHLKNSKKVISDTQSYPHSTKLLILNELNVLDDAQYKTFDWFRRLRNKAAHQPIFAVTKSDLSAVVPDEYKDPNNFYKLCVDIIIGFWNQHIPIFGPKYAPGTVGDAQQVQADKRNL